MEYMTPARRPPTRTSRKKERAGEEVAREDIGIFELSGEGWSGDLRTEAARPCPCSCSSFEFVFVFVFVRGEREAGNEH
jgi:hypothetical protein